ncbi:Arc family DNA-binding protein [Pararhodobacter oceanensis]|uniref:Arc family DNA-binding protein n=1 Tax=Pararhodobacter oceanensis TaxID=2172121 RepID=UPI003A94E419
MKAKKIAIQLRMSLDLRDTVRCAAARDGRSLNAQIVQHLRELYQADEVQEAAK